MSENSCFNLLFNPPFICLEKKHSHNAFSQEVFPCLSKQEVHGYVTKIQAGYSKGSD